MAKADLKKTESWQDAGAAIRRALDLAGLSLKEAAALCEKDVAQVARWMTGDEPPQLEAVFACPVLRQPLVIALAERAGAGVSVETTIQIRRTA